MQPIGYEFDWVGNMLRSALLREVANTVLANLHDDPQSLQRDQDRVEDLDAKYDDREGSES